MASSPTQTHQNSKEPAAGSSSKRKAKLAAGSLRINTNLPYKDDDPSTCRLVRGSPVTTIPPLPPKSERRKKGPSGVPMDSLLAPKSVFTPPLPFRRDEPGWRPPRFDRGSRPHCPEKLDLSSIPRQRFVKNGRRFYATRGTASLSPQAIPADVPLIRVPAVHAPRAKVSEAPETAVPPAQVSLMKASPAMTAPSMASTEAESVLGTMPFTDPQSPIYPPSSDSLPEIMTRQRGKRRQKKQTPHNEEHCRQIYQAHYSRSSVTESPCNQESVVCRRDERDECECTLCEDCCLVIAAMGMGMTVLLSVSTAISKVGTWLVSLTPPEEYRRY